MAIIRNYTRPIIEFISYSDFKVYHTFSESEDSSLQSYSFNRSVNNIDGAFSITIKSDSVNKDTENFINEINPLDIIIIYESDKNKKDFIGIVSNIGFANTSTQGGGIISVSGKSIDSLFNRYKISVDKTAMAVFDANASNIDTSSELVKKNENEWKPLNLNDVISISWKKFSKAVNDNKEISNYAIGNIIKHFYGDTFWDRNSANIEFEYPIANHLFKDNETKFIDYIKELLPDKVYECFGTIEQNKPVLKIRKVPFIASRWNSLTISDDNMVDVMTDYNFNRSDAEVYTCFFSYVQGSIESQDYYRAITATDKGYKSYRTSDVDRKKAALYGYEPMFLTFTGFPSGFDNETQKNNTNNNVIEKFSRLNIEANEMYGKLDEMYSGSVSLLKAKGYDFPKIGERLKLDNMEFYVTEEKHIWQYEKPININYSIIRGGYYNNGKFSMGKISSILNSITYNK